MLTFGVAALVLAVGLLWSLRSAAPRAVEVGERAPGFNLPGLNQANIKLADHRGQVVVVNFWATWCPPCVEETPSLQKFAEEMSKESVAVIGVSVDQDQTALRQFVAEHQLSFPVALDPDQVLAGRFGTYKFPESYILDRQGRVAEKIIGAIDWKDPRIITFVESLTD
jgi:peroxiredoxin